MITFRNETENDFRRVEEITREAFWNANHPGCNEHYLAHMLRAHSDFIPALDLVAEADGVMAANVMYTKAWLFDDAGNEKEILTFGPVSVLPEYQRRGIGKALLEHSYGIAREMGYDAIVIFGHPSNYVTQGFKSCKKYNVCLEGGIFPTAMLVKELKEGAFDGRRLYYRGSAAYDISEADAEEFDRLFPPKEKAYRLSQEEFYIYSHSTITR